MPSCVLGKTVRANNGKFSGFVNEKSLRTSQATSRPGAQKEKQEPDTDYEETSGVKRRKTASALAGYGKFIWWVL